MNIVKGCLSLQLILAIVFNIYPESGTATDTAEEFDLLISGGRIVDGTGNPWFLGDVAVKDGRIVEIGRIGSRRARKIIDARSKVVAPGFIDVHGHLEGNIEQAPEAENYLQMGVTSVITGNCGSSKILLGLWFGELEKVGISINVGSLAGHNAIRREGMNGDFDREPTMAELSKMRELVGQAMRDGAVGFSTGLEYVPGIYAQTGEIASLVRNRRRVAESTPRICGMKASRSKQP